MSKRAYNLQKGRQLQALHESVDGAGNSNSSSSSSGKGRVARDVAKIRDLCPPGTDDDRLVELVEKARGDSGLMESAISELWEDYRGGAQDEWATVEKKGKKKNVRARTCDCGRSSMGTDAFSFLFVCVCWLQDSWSTPTRRDGPKRQPQPQKQQTAGDEEAPADDRGAANRGRGSGVRGRGAPAARGGRGGGRGRGRGAAPRSGSTRATQNDESGEDDAEVAGESSQDQPQKTQKTEQAAPVAPTPVIPHLTGAWTKKPSFVVAAKPKPAAPAPAPAPKPAAEKPKEAAAPAAKAAASAAAPAPAVVSSPKKTAKEPSSPAPAATETTTAVSSPKKKAASPKKVQSPVAKTPEVKPAAAAEKVASPKAEKPVESASISTWGSLDVSTSAIGDWSASASTSTEKKGSSTPNAWARGSPIVTAENTQASIPTVSPGSPKDLVSPAESRAAGSAASPKYLKLGRWDTGVATNLSLQFGSFSLNGVEHVESSSPAGWASTTTATSATKTTVKAAETQNVWGTQSTSPKKKAPLSPARAAEETVHERKSAVTTSAPPGLSVESGRATPKGSQSPRTFAAPSAPSPASLPKPDEVKRSTPNRNQSAFQATAQAQQSKIGAGSTYGADFGGKSSTLYQASYGQYSMGIGGNQGQMASASGTPKSGPSRAAASAPASAQSPSHAAQQQSAQQYQQQAQAQPQQQKPAAQQGAQAQTPAQQQPQQQQGQGHHQGHPHHHQAGPPGYHPHYAPPPPPGMAMAYNPYNYASYYQGYGYYQNPQYAQYSPRTQYPPRGSIPYGVEGPMPGFSNPPNVPVGYQDQHLLAHQHDYPGAMPQGFGEVSGAYLQQGGHHHHLHQQNGPQSHGKGASQISSSTQQPRSGAAGMQGYQASSGTGARDHAASTPPVPNPAAAGASGAAAYGQHYGWASYGNQPMGGWGHMMHQGYQNPTQHQQHSGSHQQSYRQYSGNNAQAGASASDANSGNAAHGHAWSS
ncbi:hypothetical protein PINS_up007485 [Pythium insidiosum]|nr:hypothetical protein PINS_up007485 [Pythium insidiosum]